MRVYVYDLPQEAGHTTLLIMGENHEYIHTYIRCIIYIHIMYTYMYIYIHIV